MKNGSHQADLLFLPNDNGFKYCLVVVDLATRITDAQPLKNKTSKDVLEAMKKIYKGKYLKTPHYLEVDAGAEFKDVFEKYFKTRLTLRVKEAGRHQQQSVVETRNALLGRTLNKRMVAQEINTGEQSNEWVKFLPKVISAVNSHYTHPATIVDGLMPIRGSPNRG
jgi:IS30 family transposase